MPNGQVKIWVKKIGSISVQWTFSNNAPAGANLSVTRYGSPSTPCYPYGCVEVNAGSTSSGTFYMNDDGTEWLYISAWASSNLPILASIELVVSDDRGTVYSNVSDGNDYVSLSYGGMFSYDGYIPQGDVYITATALEY